MKASAYIATSIDGFIARKNGEVDWLMAAGSSESNEDYGYKEFWDTVDCLVIGRNSTEMVVGFSVWPYEGKRVVVLSKPLKDAPQELQSKIELYSGSVSSLVRKLKSEGYQRLWLM